MIVAMPLVMADHPDLGRPEMRIAMIQRFLPSSTNGGVGHSADQLAEKLVARGHHVTMFSLDAAPSGAAYSVVAPEPGSWLHRFPRAAVYGFAIWLARQDYSGFDLIHAHGDNHFLRTDTPVLRTMHGSALDEALAARRLLTRLFNLSLYPMDLLGALRAKAVVGVSSASRRHVMNVGRVISEGVDLNLFHPSDDRERLPTVLSVGHRLDDRKRLALLAEVFAEQVRPVHPEAQLWLVSDDPIDRPAIRGYHNVSTEKLAELYRRAWVFVLPSRYEGFGRPYIEAMASGTPVISSRNPGAVEVLGDGAWGVIAADDQLGESINEMLADAAARLRWSAAGLSRARAFDLERSVSEYEARYQSLAGDPQGDVLKTLQAP
jgi:glycosyltransferase involved in cell wall biosynthesis